jgi:hypothetical protein
VDNATNEFTFNPLTVNPVTGAPRWTSVAGSPLTAVACPQASQCTAVDDSGDEVTFNVRAPGNPRDVAIDAPNDILALSCPSTGQCTAVDDTGLEVTFDPVSGTVITGPIPIDDVSLNGVSCPAVAQCTAVDSSGRAVTFNPGSPAGATPVAIRGANALEAVACPSVAECVAVDAVGDSFVALSRPVPVSPPAIAGAPLEGDALTAHRGAWAGLPTSYSYQWARCQQGSCSAIPGATGQTYKLTMADVGHRIRVVETATNGVGSGSATSASTNVVDPAVSAKTLSATAVRKTAATLNGVVRTGGAAVSWRFQYGPAQPYRRSTPVRSMTAGHNRPVPVFWRVRGLKTDTEYHFRLVVSFRLASTGAEVRRYGSYVAFRTG